MELELITENRFGKFEYDRESHVLHGTFAGVFNLDLGRELFEDVMPFAKDNKIEGAVMNCLEMRGTFTKLNKWFDNVFYPHMIPLGYCCWSVASSDVFTRYAANMLINKLTPKEITAKIFGGMDDAIAFIDNHLKTKV